MAGEYEPEDSRNVTGTGSGAPQQQGVRSPGGANQQMGQQRWSGDGQQTGGQQDGPQNQGQMGSTGANSGTEGQQAQFQAESDQNGGIASAIREHMEVIGADGVHLGTVDHVDGHRIKLTRADSGIGAHSGHHHYISLGLVAGIEGNKVRLSANADVAYGFEEEE
ncbi:MAG: hypothetical protein RIS94_716 [Pseudomonadota bacterium]